MIAAALLLAILVVDIYAQQRDTARTWYSMLPACPCRNPDLNGVKLNDGWAKDKANLKKYHRGAAASYRSYPPVRTPLGYSCQQCCYDRNGDLITSGRGAGTPDKKSACKGEDKNGVMTFRFFGLIGHYWADVRPWERLMRKDSVNGWAVYNASWVPDNSGNCKINVVSK
jgi:hypothetical protein